MNTLKSFISDEAKQPWFPPVDKIARPVFTHGPVYKALRKAFDLALNIRQHFTLSRLLDEAGLLNAQHFYAGIRYRYLRAYYLGAGFSIPDRLRVAINHHQSIARHCKPDFQRRAHASGHVLWSKQHEDLNLAISLRYPYWYNHDGDLSLSLDVNGKNICITTFSIAPGAVVDAPDARVLLISSIQGVAGQIDLIRRTTEICNNVSPAHMLLFAAETLSSALGIKAIVGIGKSRMPDAQADSRKRLAFDYDAFWMPVVGADEQREFYRMALPFTDKPIEAIPAKHRSRARKRRELRNLIRQDIDIHAQAALAHSCLR